MSVIDENWNYFLDINIIESDNLREFELNLNNLSEHILNLLEQGFKVQSFNFNGNFAQSHDNELKNLMETNKQLRNEIEKKLEDLTKQKSQYENFKRDQKLLSQEIKETHEAFLMAKKYYKKYLKMYFTVESRKNEKQTVFIQFFTEAKKDSENYSVRLLRDTKTGCYELLSMTPKLKIQKVLQQKLQESNDVPGALCCIRQAFVMMKSKKK